MKKEELVSDLEAIKGYIEWEMPLNFIITLDKVIEKVKQKKPSIANSTYKCCSCGTKLRPGSNISRRIRDEYCPECGQAIDWS